MKKLFAIAGVCVLAFAAVAVELETAVDSKFSVPNSVRPSFEKMDRNFAAVNSSLALKATSLTVAYTPNRIIYLNATSNLATNDIIVPTYSIAVTP